MKNYLVGNTLPSSAATGEGALSPNDPRSLGGALKAYQVASAETGHGGPQRAAGALRAYLVGKEPGSNAGNVVARVGGSLRSYLSTGEDRGDLAGVAGQVRLYHGAETGNPTQGSRDLQPVSRAKVYLAEANGRGGEVPASTSVCLGPIRFLLSYFYFKDSDLGAIAALFPEPPDIFVDSGAYSAATTGKPIDPAAYIDWVRKWQHLITAASAPDVIGDAQASEQEAQCMLGAGLTVPVLPVYHVGEPWGALTKCCRMADYIALGGMVPYSRRQKFLRAWLAKAFTMIPTTTKVHGFGMTGWGLMQAYPWYSVDSSSWTSGVRFGQFSLFDQGRMVQVDMRDKLGLLKNSGLLERYGLSARKARSGGIAYDRDAVMVANLLSWQAAERWLNEKRQASQSTK